MTKNLKIWAVCAGLTLAAAADSRAVSATNRFNFTLTAFAQTNGTTANAGTTAVERVKRFSISTATIVADLDGASGEGVFRVVTFAGAGIPGTITYDVFSTNFVAGGDVGDRNLLPTNTATGVTSLTFTVPATVNQTTNDVPVTVTNLPTAIGTSTTNFSLTVISNATVTNLTVSNLTVVTFVTNTTGAVSLTTNEFAIGRPPALRPLDSTFTTTSSSISNGVTTTTSNTTPIFSLVPVPDSPMLFQGRDHIEGDNGRTSGTNFSLVQLNIFNPGFLILNLTGFDMATVSSTEVPARSGSFFPNTNDNINVIGFGFLGGTVGGGTVTNVVTNADLTVTTNVQTGVPDGTPILVRGTVTTRLVGRVR